ncbi:MAG: sugar ABC transporter permease [Lachnospiraceae bacterium]|nr:sugar ABC transporter permease [Lachnospiraceae bacterium]
MAKRKMSQTRRDRRFGFVLIIPIIIVIFGVMGYPFLRAVYLSFTDKVVGSQESFAGLKNYKALIADPIYWKSLKNTMVYTVGCIGAKFLLGLLLAVILNQSFKGKGFFRTVLLIPWAIPGMVVATTWRWMYDSTYGIINSLLISAGISKVGIFWLSDTNLTLLSTMIVNVWRGVPFFMFSILGALQTLDKQQYEAAYVDGAGSLRQFWYITLPSIAGVLGITTLLSTIWTFNDFENVYLITGGGPLYSSSTIATYTYDMAFIQNNFAGALSVAVSVVPILLILIILYTKHNREET